jgi:hypothetical protein
MNEVQFIRTQQAAQTPFSNSGNGFIADDVQEAIEEVRTFAALQRYNIISVNNGRLSNLQRMGYSEILPNTPVIVPKNCTLKEITYSNSDITADAQFDIYRRSPPLDTPVPGGTATLLQTWNITNVIAEVLSGMVYLFNAGDEILIVYTDAGTKPLDCVLVIFFLSE